MVSGCPFCDGFEWTYSDPAEMKSENDYHRADEDYLADQVRFTNHLLIHLIRLQANVARLEHPRLTGDNIPG